MKLHRIAFVLASIVAAGTASAGTAKVSFIQPERFAVELFVRAVIRQRVPFQPPRTVGPATALVG